MKQKQFFGYFEIVFDALYLLAALTVGVYFLFAAKDFIHTLSGILALTLAFGDAFHLVPRIASILSGNKARFQKMLGLGKLVTSITMTLFYVLLWQICAARFYVANADKISIVIYALAGLRIALCLLPQNRWFIEKPPIKWGIIRNIPFVLLGICLTILFGEYGYYGSGLSLMWIAIILSFAFYLPVVLFSNRIPAIGMMMLPKSCVYIWILYMLLFV